MEWEKIFANHISDKELIPQIYKEFGDTGLGFPGGMVPQCQVEVLYFAKSAEITGIRSETISVPQEIKALQLWNEIETQHSGSTDVRNQVIFAVPQEYVKLGDQLLLLQSGDEIAIIPPTPPPPVSGG
ncbi:molybdopterin synthase sulfur carrier subunit-like [Sagmatias obliquidens]|uniref:molybdopterin synthase sulfur carrier subunit-like n=2 Tax=Delphinidae TaxID=9726 RepID=UPI000F44581E|nr:molybdopterin synthase sulfur carrier subunit-like [Lagenorhynchus obliquidens]